MSWAIPVSCWRSAAPSYQTRVQLGGFSNPRPVICLPGVGMLGSVMSDIFQKPIWWLTLRMCWIRVLLLGSRHTEGVYPSSLAHNLLIHMSLSWSTFDVFDALLYMAHANSSSSSVRCSGISQVFPGIPMVFTYLAHSAVCLIVWSYNIPLKSTSCVTSSKGVKCN